MNPLVLGTLAAAAAAAAAPLPLEQATLAIWEPNPSGLQTGFWANYSMSGSIVHDFGPRPLERVNFHKWSQFEKSPGVIRLDEAFKWERRAHLAGSTIITNVNTFFTLQLNPQGMASIPAHYAPDIRDPATRAAARQFLTAFTQKLLGDTGSAWIALDYEMLWFAKPTKPEIRQAYRDWFLESAALCRETAAAMGASDRLKIGVIVNTDPFDTAGHSIGSPAASHQPQTWLLDCVATADFVGFDTYAGGAQGTTTPETQLRAMRFWLQHYVGNKPFFITESGFSTSVQEGDTRKGYHIRGTEAQQAAFFTAMFDALARARSTPGDPLAHVRGYLIWKYADRMDETDLVERHLGLVRTDGTPKPALAVVQESLRRIDADPLLSPVRRQNTNDVLPLLREGKPIQINRISGTSYTTLELSFTPPRGATAVQIRAATASPVCLIAGTNGVSWVSTHPEPSTHPLLTLPLRPEAPAGPVHFTVHFTAERLPLRTELLSLKITPSPTQH